MVRTTGKEIISNLIWRMMERFGAQGVTFIVSLVLARVLDPEIYGTVALVTVITSILQVFIDGGLGAALIQKKDADNYDFSTVFYFNIVFCFMLYGVLFISAPLFASAYSEPDLTPVVRTSGLILIISGVKNILQAYVSKYLLFKKFFFATLGGTIAAAITGIWMAYHGYGVWALVAQNLINTGIDTIILWMIVRWRPKCYFSYKRLRILFSYGWKLLVSALIDRLWTQLRQLIIGGLYSAKDLAFYNKGHEFPEYATAAINTSIDSVLLPVMAKSQDNIEEVRDLTRRSIMLSSYVMWPVMMGLSACAEPMIRILITEKWIAAVPYLRIFCITYAFYPVHSANLSAIKAVGRSDIFLKLEIIKKVSSAIILFVSMWSGPMVMAFSLLISGILGQVINSWPNKKLLGYSYRQQVRDIFPSVLLSAFMFLAVYLISFLPWPDLLIISVQIPVGILVYILGSAIFKMEPFLLIMKVLFRKDRIYG